MEQPIEQPEFHRDQLGAEAGAMRMKCILVDAQAPALDATRRMLAPPYPSSEASRVVEFVRFEFAGVCGIRVRGGRFALVLLHAVAILVEGAKGETHAMPSAGFR